jgi:CBS domain-containing protein
MIPLSEYATVSEDATLYDAVIALEKAQEEFDQSKYRHRAILVFDATKKIVGKVSQNDVIMALETKYKELGIKGSISRLGFSNTFLKSMFEQYHLWDTPFDKICEKAAQLKVKDIMYTPTEGDFVREDASLSEAIHQLVIGNHQSLLVTDGKDIVGILRLTDVFNEVSHMIKACQV